MHERQHPPSLKEDSYKQFKEGDEGGRNTIKQEAMNLDSSTLRVSLGIKCIYL